MILSNVNIGSGPSAGDGDPLRSAFIAINNNFQIVKNNVNALTNSVTSVAGRTGNVVLTVNDIVGYSTTAYVSQANLTVANTATRNYVDAAIAANISALVGGAPGALNTLNELATALANDASYSTSITNSIANTNNNITVANAALKVYVDGQISAVNSAVSLANTIQSAQIATANTGIKGYIDNAVSTANVGIIGYIDQGNTIQASAITAANLGMKGYVDSVASQSIYGNVNVQAYTESMGFSNFSNVNVAAYVTTANSAIIGYIDQANTIQSQQIASANIGIIGYIDLANTIQSGQVGAANLAIVAANLGMKGYVDSVASQSIYGNGNVLSYLTQFDGNIVPSANVTYSLGSITNQWKDLFVSNNTIYLGGVPVSISGGNLTVNGNAVGGTNLATYSGNVGASSITLDSATGPVGDAKVLNGGNGFTMFGFFAGSGGSGSGLSVVPQGSSLFDPVQINTRGTNYRVGDVITIVNTNEGNGYSNASIVVTSLQNQPAPSIFVGNSAYKFGADGNIVLPAGGGILDSTGASVLGGSYSNVQVATYLPTYSGNVANIRLDSSGVLTFADGTTQTTAASGGGGNGNVSSTGGSYVDNALIRYDGTSGNSIAVSLVTVSDTGAITAPSVGSVIPFYFANTAVFPSASTYHGAVAHSHVDGKMYFAHSGVWLALANESDINNFSNVQVAAYLASNITLGMYRGTTNILGNLIISTGTGDFGTGTIEVSGNIIQNASTTPYYINTTGNLIVGGNVSIGGTLSTAGNIANIRLGTSGVLTFADGTTQTTAASGGGSSYGNANVASYLPTYSGVVTASNVAVNGNVTATYFVGNGAFLTGIVGGAGNYGNIDVKAFLETDAGPGDGFERKIEGYYSNIILGDSTKLFSYGSSSESYFGHEGFGNIQINYIRANNGDVRIATNNGAYTWIFDNTGNLTLSGNTFSVNYANGTPITFSSSSYSNVQVETYLPTYSGNIANIRLGVSGVLTFSDGTTQITAASGGGSSYGNGNVLSYLTQFNGNIVPSANVTYSLGSDTNRWKDLYLSGNTIFLGDTTITTSGGAVLTPVTRQLFSQSFLPGSTNSAATFTLDRLPTAGSTRTVLVIGVQGGGPAPSYILTEGVDFTISGLSLIITASYTATNISCTESYSDTGDLITATEVATDTITPTSGDLTVSGNVTVDGDLYVSPTSIYMGNLRISAADGNLKVNTAIKFSDDSVQSTAYSNVQVATYLPTYSGNVANVRLDSSGVLTFADGTVQTTAASGGSNYGNANVTAYTESMGFTNYSNVNVSALITTNGLTNYSNVNTKAYTETMGFQNFGNVNVAAYVTTANSAVIGYVDNAVSTANVGVIGYIDRGNTIVTTGITTANVGMKGYVDAGIIWSISASGSTDYVFSGPGIVAGNTNDPVLYLYKGFTYTFINTTGGSHPFAIRVSNGGADYTSGVSGSQTGTQIFTVPMNAPSTLYYQCTIHSGMGNTINIV